MKKDKNLNNVGNKIEMSSFSYPEQSFVEEEQPMPGKIRKRVNHEDTLKEKKKTKEAEESVINMTDIREARKKEKNKKRVKKLIIILIIAILGLTAYLTRNLWVKKLEGIFDRPHQTIVNDGKTQKGNFPISRVSSSVNFIDVMDGYIVSADDSHIYLYSESGAKQNVFYHELEDPIVKISNKRILAYDNGGNTFKMYSKKEETYSKTIDNSILFAEIGSSGYAAVITQTEKYPACMTVYDENGSEVYRWSSGQRIMDVSFNASGDGCYVTTFSSENGELCSVIHYVEFDTSEEQMTSVKLDSLVIDTCENNNDGLWAVGDSKFYKLDEDGKIIMEYEYTDDLVSYCINKYSAAVVVNSATRGKGTLALFDSEEENPEIAQTNGGTPKKLTLSGRKVFLLNERSAEAYDMNGNCLATADISDEYTDFAYLNDSLYLMGYRAINKIEFNT